MSINGVAATRTAYGAWHLSARGFNPASVVATDRAGRTIAVTLNNDTANQDTGKQLPVCR